MTRPLSPTLASVPPALHVETDQPPSLPEPAALPDVVVRVGRYEEECLRDNARSVGQALHDAWVEAAADAVLEVLRTDLRSGALPTPHEHPSAFEAALATRAEAAAQRHLCPWGGWAQMRSVFDVLRFARCGPAARPGEWQTPVAAFGLLSVPGADTATGDEQPSGSVPSGAPSLCVLRPGAQHGASTLGFDVDLRWDAFACRVLRNDVLRALATRDTAQRELLLDPMRTGGPEVMPCRVGPAPASPLAPSTRARRRRS